jgi:hypothetical protein
MVVATSIVAIQQCSLKSKDFPLNLAVAKLGQDLVDFMPDGRYAPLVEVKRAKAIEWILADKTNGCEGIHEVLLKYLPDIYK